LVPNVSEQEGGILAHCTLNVLSLISLQLSLAPMPLFAIVEKRLDALFIARSMNMWANISQAGEPTEAC
jgi:hypothetical protein